MRARRQRIRNPSGEAALFRARAFVGFGIVLLALGALAFRLLPQPASVRTDVE